MNSWNQMKSYTAEVLDKAQGQHEHNIEHKHLQEIMTWIEQVGYQIITKNM